MADEQIKFPVQVLNGRLAMVDQASVEFTAGQVEIVCLTPVNSLPGAPGLGLAEQRFRRGGADIGEIERQLGEWVPEAKETIDRDPAALDRGLDLLDVKVSR